MSEQEPKIFDLDYQGLDPERAPRMTAFILLACGLLGVAFLLVNVFGTGDDPYYNQAEWDEGNEPVHQRYDILPNMVRGRQAIGDSDEDEEAQIPVQKPVVKKPIATTNPLSAYQRPTPGTPTTPAVPGAPTTPLPTLPGGSSLTTPRPAPGTR